MKMRRNPRWPNVGTERWKKKCSSISRQAIPKKYIYVLDDFVERYNNTRHSSIKMTPVEASKKENEVRVYRNLYPDLKRLPMRAKFKTGDKVRIQKKKGLFEKGFTPNWTEVFTVSKIQKTNPVTYTITDLNDEEIQGTLYEQVLQKTSQEVYRIEKIVKKDKTRSLVKWKGYPESFNSWVDNKDLIKLWNKCQMILEYKAQQSLRFWTTSSHQSNVKNYK